MSAYLKQEREVPNEVNKNSNDGAGYRRLLNPDKNRSGENLEDIISLPTIESV